jgi:hypothetical protein
MVEFFGNCDRYRYKIYTAPSDHVIAICDPNPKDLQAVFAWASERKEPFRLCMAPYTNRHQTYGEYVLDGEPDDVEIIGSFANVEKHVGYSAPIDPNLLTIGEDDELTWPCRFQPTINWLRAEAFASLRKWLLPNPRSGLTGIEEHVQKVGPIHTKALVNYLVWQTGITKSQFFEHYKHVSNGSESYVFAPVKKPYPLQIFGADREEIKAAIKALLRNEKEIPVISNLPDNIKWFHDRQVMTSPPSYFLMRWLNIRLEQITTERQEKLGNIVWNFRDQIFSASSPEAFLREDEFNIPREILDVKVRDITRPTENNDILETISQNFDHYFDF